MQYFEMIVISVIKGNKIQAKIQFKLMTKKYKKLFVKSIFSEIL